MRHHEQAALFGSVRVGSRRMLIVFALLAAVTGW